MKPELNRQGATVTTVVHDAQPLPTPMLDAAVEHYHLKQDYPLLHEVVENALLPVIQPKRKYHYEYGPCYCGYVGMCRRGAKRRRVYDDEN